MNWKKRLYIWKWREKEETKSIKEILKQLNDEDEDTKFEEEVEEVMKLGLYIEGGVRLIKPRLKTQTATEKDLSKDLPTQGYRRI